MAFGPTQPAISGGSANFNHRQNNSKDATKYLSKHLVHGWGSIMT